MMFCPTHKISWEVYDHEECPACQLQLVLQVYSHVHFYTGHWAFNQMQQPRCLEDKGQMAREELAKWQ